MSKCIVFEDGILTRNILEGDIWCGLFSRAAANSSMIKYIQSCLPKNTIFAIPRCDGDLRRIKTNQLHDIDWATDIQPHINAAKSKNKIFMLGVLSQVGEDKDINYVYLPLDDVFFDHGTINSFPPHTLPPWESRSSTLCWRGGCSGIGGSESLRVRFVRKLYNYKDSEQIRLSWSWSENKNIEPHLFGDRLDWHDFLKYKIFFVVDGNVIASNHMWGFATGCVVFIVSNGTCWFTQFAIPYVHYIPIEHNLSNLLEQIEWIRNNDDKAKIMAQNALEFSAKYFSPQFQRQYIKDSIDKYT